MQIKHFLIGSANVGVLSFLNGFGTVQAGSVGEVVIKSIFSMLGGVVVSLALPVLKKKFPESKIIVISALNENTIKMNDEKICADAYLTKPFTKEELLTLVNKILP